MPTSLPGVNGNPLAGQSDFLTIAGTGTGTKATCNKCQVSNPGPGSNWVIDTQFSQPLKVPELRNIYQKQLYARSSAATIDGFGMDHEGHIPDFTAFLNQSQFKSGYNTAQKKDISAFSLCFDTGTAPAVGYTRTMTAATLASALSDWTTLQSQATIVPPNTAPNIDLIGRGTINGAVRGLLYQPSSNNYIDDTGALYTQSDLQGKITAGDTLSIMGVYPGTGSAQ